MGGAERAQLCDSVHAHAQWLRYRKYTVDHAEHVSSYFPVSLVSLALSCYFDCALASAYKCLEIKRKKQSHLY